MHFVLKVRSHINSVTILFFCFFYLFICWEHWQLLFGLYKAILLPGKCSFNQPDTAHLGTDCIHDVHVFVLYWSSLKSKVLSTSTYTVVLTDIPEILSFKSFLLVLCKCIMYQQIIFYDLLISLLNTRHVFFFITITKYTLWLSCLSLQYYPQVLKSLLEWVFPSSCSLYHQWLVQNEMLQNSDRD